MFQNSIQRRNASLKLVGEVAKIRDNVKKAFAALRKNEHVICRMNYLCCMSCASSDLSQQVDDKQKKGAVYFHNQDNASFKETGRLCIRYFTRTDSQDSKKLGETIVQYLTEHGVETDWDGDPTRVIFAGKVKGDE
jgi:hypothetical protein